MNGSANTAQIEEELQTAEIGISRNDSENVPRYDNDQAATHTGRLGHWKFYRLPDKWTAEALHGKGISNKVAMKFNATWRGSIQIIAASGIGRNEEEIFIIDFFTQEALSAFARLIKSLSKT